MTPSSTGLCPGTAALPRRHAGARLRDGGARRRSCSTTGPAQVLFAKDADSALPPASMSKLMTAYLVFEQLQQGRLKLDDMLPVSETAWKMGGSQMFLEVGDRVSVSDLLRGIIIQSGNDACVVARRGPGRQRGRLRRDDERQGRRARADQQPFRQLHRPRRAGPPDERARPRHAGPPHHPGVPRVLLDLFASGSTPSPTSGSPTAILCSRPACPASTA